MFNPFKKPPLFRGRLIPSRRFTLTSFLYFTVFFALPVLALTAILDLIGWFIASKMLGSSCYGILCLFWFLSI